MSDVTEKAADVLPPPGLRFKLGLVFFVLAWVSPLFVPLVALTDLPNAAKAALSGALVVGGPEIFGFMAIACLGKAGFGYLTQKVMALFRRYGPQREVSRFRYNVGLAWERIGSPRDALAAFDRTLDLEPDFPGAERHRTFAAELVERMDSRSQPLGN